jgi:hypothetical protein
MGAVTFPTDAVIANSIPTNGNTVPITGTQAITNHSEGLAYYGLAYQNICDGAEINFGGLTGIQPVARCYTAFTDKGEAFLQVVAYIPLSKNYAAFPNGKKLWKQVTERFPEGTADASFNY